jgi:hypothetical protein
VTAQALAAKLDAPLGAVELDLVALYARGLVEKVWPPGTTRFGWRMSRSASRSARADPRRPVRPED